MKVVFVGGKNIGYGCLKCLLDNEKAEVLSVVVNKDGDTQPGRWFQSVSELAIEHNLRIFKPDNINDKTSVDFIKKLNPDIIIVAYYDQILKSHIIQIPKNGCVNVHMGLCEEYRGCYPTTWPIINGEDTAGVTVHYIDEGIDSGDIISQIKVGISKDDTGETLYNKCTEAGIQLFKDTVGSLLSGEASSRKQVKTEKTKTYFRKNFPSHNLDLANKDKKLYNYIRALMFKHFSSPFFYIGNKKIILKEEDNDT